MKQREVTILQKNGQLLVLLSREPQPLFLRQLAMDCGFRMGDLCARLNISERHLRRVFDEGIGMSPKDWLRQERMVAAREWLRSGASIKETSIDLGFTNSKMFSRDFQFFYGVRPTDFQRREQEIVLNAI